MDETEQWKEISSTSTGAAEPETPGQHSQIDEIRINLTILDEVEGLEDRVNGASLQGKVGDIQGWYWRLSARLQYLQCVSTGDTAVLH